MDIKCVICDTPLSGDIDTYGDIGHEMCFTCWFTLNVGQSGVCICAEKYYELKGSVYNPNYSFLNWDCPAHGVHMNVPRVIAELPHLVDKDIGERIS